MLWEAAHVPPADGQCQTAKGLKRKGTSNIQANSANIPDFTLLFREHCFARSHPVECPLLLLSLLENPLSLTSLGVETSPPAPLLPGHHGQLLCTEVGATAGPLCLVTSAGTTEGQMGEQGQAWPLELSRVQEASRVS